MKEAQASHADVESGREYFDRIHLKTAAYADSRKLRDRTNLYQYQQPKGDFREWAISHLQPDLGSVLDVGCGPGDYLRRIFQAASASSLVGVDLSPGMLAEVDDLEVNTCVADAQHLPFRDNSFDTVLCMHMLYHVKDINSAIRELRRVARPGGTVLIATNSSDHQRQLRDAFDSAVAALSSKKIESVLSTERRFRLEDAAEMLPVHFASVKRHDLPRELVLPKVRPLVNYLSSIRSFHESKLPADVSWDEAEKQFLRQVQAEIDSAGTFRSVIHAGIFVCR